MREALDKWLKKQGVEVNIDVANQLCNSLGLDDEERVDGCLALAYQFEKGDISEADFTGGLCVLTSKKPDEVAEILRNLKKAPSEPKKKD